MRDSQTPSSKAQRENPGPKNHAPKTAHRKTTQKRGSSPKAGPKKTVPQTGVPKKQAANRKGTKRQQNPGEKSRPNAGAKGSGPNYRQRRLIALGVVLGLVAALIAGGVVAVKEAQSWFAKQKLQAEQLRLALAERTYPPPGQCGGQDLALTLENRNPIAYPRQGISTQITVRNQGKKPCLVQVSGKTLGIQIVSGNEIIYNSTTCAGEEKKQLLLDAADTWSQEFKWDGHNASPQCGQAGIPALPGTYRVVIWKEGQPASEESVFAVQPPPEPVPAPAEAPAPAPAPANSAPARH